MTKDDIATRICEKTRTSKDDASNIIETMFNVIKSSLERGEKIKISNFGNFAVRSKNQRKGRNPQSGAEIVIPARKVLTFKPSPVMKKAVGGEVP